MSGGQQIIKVLAIIFAVILIVNIFGWIIFGASALLDIAFVGEEIGQELRENNSKNNEQSSQTIQNTEVFSKEYSNISNLKVNIDVANLTIKKGNSFKVEGNNLPRNFSSSAVGNTLIVKENSNKNTIKIKGANITITVPESIKLTRVEINAGVGNNKIEDITTTKFVLDSGVGNMTINNLVSEDTNIDAGAGELKITNSKLKNLDFDSGVGNCTIGADITGNSKIDCGLGNINLDLTNEKSKYKITISKGIGNVTLNGEKCKESQTYGDGENRIRVSGGIGNIKITTNE